MELYSLGPSWMQFEDVPESYYRDCGTYRIYNYAFYTNEGCSFKNLINIPVSTYKCYVSTLRYEIQRPSTVQSSFGVHGINVGIVIFAPPLLTFVIFLGTLNLIVLRHMRKSTKNGGGTLIYHQMNIGCDLLAAFLQVAPDFFSMGNFATAIFHAFTGLFY